MAPSQSNKAGSLTVWGGILLALFLLNGVGAMGQRAAAPNLAQP